MPWYWLMSQNLPDLENRSVDVSIQLVRPPGFDNKGCDTLTIPHHRLEEARMTLLEILEKGLRHPIRTTEQFPALGDPVKHCKLCLYATMCEGPNNEDDVESEFEE